ncbi:TetR/AcrR family transcriptional regulator [Mycobacterium gordonae]|uniref:Transcriptional regulator n=1 Tax=Mycobacterium gordonae TaxID=1778 RepID=A0A1X1VNJ8_MYCGO|nr:TetR/AcrR family transcriptional regulator [Mycobacterium gordonae]MBI2698744.1 TetR/AcrR family transcriptional regulator [Mycobacterium sp.]MCQ4364144.1 TetR/AcrR family transcriptional regulator [Mycobacterium gordonae]MCV7010574.1 TetR/AcrR family transcriptional regulator [Mycobacterium gordonae]ODR17380.1 transcriptional regulator [Mycobacterium gordonae]ORV70569.1 transcriptional regulator [Mycobacterium gordonae]
MPHDDWLVGRDRATEATARILNAAADLISRHGYGAFSIDALAAKVHCSPATIYRHAGGKTAIRDAVVAMHANRIVERVRDAISGLSGSDRVVTATAIALESIRSDPLAQIMQAMHTAAESDGLLRSPMLAHFAAEMLGHSAPDPLAEQWLIRVFLALWTWPLQESGAERQMLQRFLGPPYGQLD